MGVNFEKYTCDAWDDSSVDHVLTAALNRMILVFGLNAGIGAPAGSVTGCTVGGQAATLIDGLASPDGSISWYNSAWYYIVPAGWSGTKVVAISGALYRPLVMAIELSNAFGILQSAKTGGDDAFLELSGVLAPSLCVDGGGFDGYTPPSIDEGGTLIYKAGHNDGDNRLDGAWGFSREAGVGDVQMGWNATTSTRAYIMVEVQGGAPPRRMAYPRGRQRFPHYVSEMIDL